MAYKEKPIYAELSYKVGGILFAVHNENGRYRNEQQYCDAIENYLKLYKIKYEREKVLPISFIGEHAGRNKVDFLIEGKIILEIKAKRMLEKHDYYQLKRYLVALNKKLGLLINFRDKFLHSKRVLNSLAKE
ncbi:MAG: GxxExxY protein [Candidatus Sungbacteria bacterium]|nr:GxxExxY protein [Candidatus Sungbacteria bacterium]